MGCYQSHSSKGGLINKNVYFMSITRGLLWILAYGFLFKMYSNNKYYEDFLASNESLECQLCNNTNKVAYIEIFQVLMLEWKK